MDRKRFLSQLKKKLKWTVYNFIVNYFPFYNNDKKLIETINIINL